LKSKSIIENEIKKLEKLLETDEGSQYHARKFYIRGLRWVLQID